MHIKDTIVLCWVLISQWLIRTFLDLFWPFWTYFVQFRPMLTNFYQCFPMFTNLTNFNLSFRLLTLFHPFQSKANWPKLELAGAKSLSWAGLTRLSSIKNSKTVRKWNFWAGLSSGLEKIKVSIGLGLKIRFLWPIHPSKISSKVWG